jgi:hypothetical protein
MIVMLSNENTYSFNFGQLTKYGVEIYSVSAEKIINDGFSDSENV